VRHTQNCWNVNLAAALINYPVASQGNILSTQTIWQSHVVISFYTDTSTKMDKTANRRVVKQQVFSLQLTVLVAQFLAYTVTIHCRLTMWHTHRHTVLESLDHQSSTNATDNSTCLARQPTMLWYDTIPRIWRAIKNGCVATTNKFKISIHNSTQVQSSQMLLDRQTDRQTVRERHTHTKCTVCTHAANCFSTSRVVQQTQDGVMI